jgi:hypothetical protein
MFGSSGASLSRKLELPSKRSLGGDFLKWEQVLTHAFGRNLLRISCSHNNLIIMINTEMNKWW